MTRGLWLSVVVVLASAPLAWGQAHAPASATPAKAAEHAAPKKESAGKTVAPTGKPSEGVKAKSEEASGSKAPAPARNGNPALALDPKVAEVTPVTPGSREAARKTAPSKDAGVDVDAVVARINQRLKEAEERRRRTRQTGGRTGGAPTPPAKLTPLPPMQRVTLTWRVPLTWPDFATPQ